MNELSQRDLFLSGEGDAWHARNEKTNIYDTADSDFLIPSLLKLPLPHTEETSVAEIGCGQGTRLEFLHRNLSWQVSGIDPSSLSVASALKLGVKAQVGTADNLPYKDTSLDIVIFGFCLCWCDRADLFKISQEAHRVLKPDAWLAIVDFWSPHPLIRPYHHHPGISTLKFDVPSMFTWHPSYTLMDHQIRHHSSKSYTDQTSEWIALSILRKSDTLSV